jgi:hypothetical protein
MLSTKILKKNAKLNFIPKSFSKEVSPVKIKTNKETIDFKKIEV